MKPNTMKSTCSRRDFITLAGGVAASLGLVGCAQGSASSGAASTTEAAPTGALAFNMGAWNHDDDNDVWWQTGVAYCENPATTDYETLGIYVPGAYLTGKDNGDGTFTCTLASDGSAGGYTAATAPMVIPINTAGYSAQKAPTSYSYDSVSAYLEVGFVYVYPGCRGRDNGYDESGSLTYSGGAPWGVTDLKAAVRYLRYNASLLPGNTDAIFTFGHSGGGAQSALMGATGDAAEYTPYLESIGAAMHDAAGGSASDAVAGSMCWCPITCLDQADAAYEWMMGQFASTGTRADGTWTKALSGHLAQEYADYINDLGLVGGDGNELQLESSGEGVSLAGSYYEHLVSVVEGSLNDFLSATEFPYTPGSSEQADGGFGGGLSGEDGAGGPSDGGAPSDGGTPPDGNGSSGAGAAAPDGAPSGEAPSGAPSGTSGASASSDAEASDSALASPPDSASSTMGSAPGAAASGAAPGGSSSADATTYETASSYITALNEAAGSEWISYDEATGVAQVTSLAGFVSACKPASKDVGAFDATDRSQAENKLFGNDENDALHFDVNISNLLDEHATDYAAYADWDSTLPNAWASDLKQTDALGGDLETRATAYNPLAYLCDHYKAFGTSTVAPHWRIRTGIEQGDTSLTTEMNLALALQAYDAVNDVDFATIWGQGHTTAELKGSSTSNFIDWVNSCVG